MKYIPTKEALFVDIITQIENCIDNLKKMSGTLPDELEYGDSFQISQNAIINIEMYSAICQKTLSDLMMTIYGFAVADLNRNETAIKEKIQVLKEGF